MAEAAEQLEEENALGMSDEDIMNMTEPPAASEPADNSGDDDGVLRDDNGSEQQPAPEGGSGEGDDPGDGDPEGNASGDEPSGDKPLGPGEKLRNAFGEGEQASADDPDKKEPKAAKVVDTDPDAPGEAAKKIDFEAEFKRLTAPFKANGKQMQVAGVDDALTLMRMGANYNKKMAGLKPNMRLLKMLDNNDLLDETKISHLIDLSKKDPGAIAQLIKEGDIDPLDIDTENAADYKPGTYTVDDSEVELNETLEGIQDTDSFAETIDIISNKWDAKSKQIALDKPKLIATINEQVASGVYAEIMGIVEDERMYGRLSGLTDIDAYKYVGDRIKANGGFDAPAAAGDANAAPAPVTPAAGKPTADPKLKSRKRAAAATKGSPSKAAADYNPLAMSDEDFEKASAALM